MAFSVADLDIHNRRISSCSQCLLSGTVHRILGDRGVARMLKTDAMKLLRYMQRLQKKYPDTYISATTIGKQYVTVMVQEPGKRAPMRELTVKPNGKIRDDWKGEHQ